MSRMSVLFCLFGMLFMLTNGQDVASQQAPVTTVYGSLDATLRVDGKSFAVRFSPEVQSTEQVANAFCTQKGEELGITQETLGNCVNGVNQYLQQVVDSWLVEKTLQVPISIDGNRFEIRFLPEKQTVDSMATSLCQQQAELLKLTAETFANCTNPVKSVLRQAVNRWVQEKTLDVPLTINGTQFDLTFLPERQSADVMARKLCTENAVQLGVTTETFENCFSPVAQYLNAAVERWIRSKTLQFNVNIDNKPYPFTIYPERQSAVNVARDFCVNNAKEFELTEETVVEKCINPIFEVIRQNIARWVDSKQLVLPISTKTGQTLNVYFVPERETTETAASRFCATQATALGLTNETYVSDCVAPVFELLEKAVENLIQQQRAAQQQQQAVAAAST